MDHRALVTNLGPPNGNRNGPPSNNSLGAQSDSQLAASVQAHTAQSIETLTEKVQDGELALVAINRLLEAQEDTNKQMAASMLSLIDGLRDANDKLDESRKSLLKTEHKYEELKNAHTETKNKLALTDRGMYGVEMALGLRDLRHFVRDNGCVPRSITLDLLHLRTNMYNRKVETVMSWFERLAIHDLKADEIEAFFAEQRKKDADDEDDMGMDWNDLVG
ncbi:hypothetical protein BT67DRAFT_290276 [Trichocladium antarcticum]|uniref:Uncharacterized protein n=1 Tax=Trichocladium antarcticum TaxID=1450529 RepID=A0AAN6UL54_9PEZI|nr:hypothetical protein BT67DRAFT_290276 [Trichocladium antarcticum]